MVKNMQLGSGGTGIPVDSTITITSSFSGNTAVNLINTGVDNQTQDATTVEFAIDSNFANVTMGYTLSNTATSDFSDSATTGTFVTDANGNATVSKTITSTGGNKTDVVFNAIRPGSNVVIGSANAVNIYELTPITMSGGDTTTTTNIAQSQYNQDGNIMFASRIHRFTTSGDATLTITDFGNYDGNANIWENQYMTTTGVGASLSQGSYWQDGIAIRSLIIGSGGNGNDGSGAGELGVLRYPFANVSAGSYTMHPAYNQSNSYVFKGNVTLEKMAGAGDTPGGAGYTMNWGSGAGATAPTSGSFIKIQAAQTDLAENVANASYPTNLSEFVEFASAFRGGGSGVIAQDGGGGAGGIGGQFNNPETSQYGISPFGKGGSAGDGGHGISFVNTRNYPATSVSPQQSTELSSNIATSWHLNPMADGTESVEDVAGGKSGSSGGDGIGASGFGGGGSTLNKYGLVTINYPYRPAYRFITSTDLS